MSPYSPLTSEATQNHYEYLLSIELRAEGTWECIQTAAGGLSTTSNKIRQESDCAYDGVADKVNKCLQSQLHTLPCLNFLFPSNFQLPYSGDVTGNSK